MRRTENLPERILSGISILEWGQQRSVQLTGMLLAEQGARVTRITHKKDRRTKSSVSYILNREKQVIELDIDNQADFKKFLKLIKSTRIFITHLSSKQLADLGIRLDHIRSKENPLLISCSLPNNLSSSDLKDSEWTEERISILSGLYASPIGKPKYFSLPLASTFTTFYALNAIAMALIGKIRYNIGNHIEIPLIQAAKTLQILIFFKDANPPTIWEPFHMLASPFMGILKTATNQHVYLHLGVPRHLRSFLIILGKAGFSDEKNSLKATMSKQTRRDPTMLGGVKEAVKINRILKKLFLKRDALYWENLLGNAGLCCVKVRSVDEWLTHPQPWQSGEIIQLGENQQKTLKAPGKLLQWDNEQNISSPYVPKNAHFPIQNLDQGSLKDASKKDEDNSYYPLAGIKILDFSRVIAGPFAGRLFAEYGAEVLQVNFRKGHLLWEEPFLVIFGGGKKSISMDLSCPEGREAFNKIIMNFKPDIVIHNFSPKILKKLQIDKQSLLKINQNIIYIAITAYNTQGPWKDRVGFEWNIQASCGLVSSLSNKQNPQILTTPVNDMSTGLIACFGGTLALYNLLKHKKGNDISVALSASSFYFLLDQLNKQQPMARLIQNVNQFYQAKDGWFLLLVRDDHIGILPTLPGLEILAKKTKNTWKSELKKILRKKDFQWWQNQILITGLSNYIEVIKFKKTKQILCEELQNEDSLFEFKNHDVFGKALVARSPVTMSPSPLKSVTPAHYFGLDTLYFLSQVDMKSIKLEKKLLPYIPPLQKETRWRRIWWMLRQIKWIIAILYKYAL